MENFTNDLEKKQEPDTKPSEMKNFTDKIDAPTDSES